jgi:hypothetical protein
MNKIIMNITIYDHTPLNINLSMIVTKYVIFKPHPFIKELFDKTSPIRFVCNHMEDYKYVTTHYAYRKGWWFILWF